MEPVLDLRAITDVVLSDVGATVQVFRAGAHGGDGSGPRRSRVEDCLILLGWGGLRAALGSVFPEGDEKRHAGAREFWRRARLTAEFSRSVARRCDGIDPSQAYLAGLLHELGRLPAILGWAADGIDLRDLPTVARALASEWELPAWIEDAFPVCDLNANAEPPLRRIVSLATGLANAVTPGWTMPKVEFRIRTRLTGEALSTRTSHAYQLRQVLLE